MKCDLLLYHSVQYMPIVPDFANGNAITETNGTLRNECRQNLLNAVKKLGQGFVATEGYHPKIAYESGEGNLGDNISLLTARQDIELVVMGGRSGGALDHLLTGSETAAVIKDSKKPVLVIPKSSHLSSVRKIAMATDFHATDFNALNFLYELAQQYDARLDVVHVVKPGSVITDIEPELLFRRHMTNVDPMRIAYKQLLGDSTSDLLSHYCKENEVDLLAVTHQRRGGQIPSGVHLLDRKMRLLVNESLPGSAIGLQQVEGRQKKLHFLRIAMGGSGNHALQQGSHVPDPLHRGNRIFGSLKRQVTQFLQTFKVSGAHFQAPVNKIVVGLPVIIPVADFPGTYRIDKITTQFPAVDDEGCDTTDFGHTQN